MCIPKTEVMIPTQGFSPGLFGRRTRSLGRGGRRGGASFVLPPLGGMAVNASTDGNVDTIVDTSEDCSQLLQRCRLPRSNCNYVGESASLAPRR